MTPSGDGHLVTAVLVAVRADGTTVGRGEATFYQSAAAGDSPAAGNGAPR